MATSLTPNLKLRIESNFTDTSKYNLNRIDNLASLYQTDSTAAAVVRSALSIKLEPNSPDLGASGTGGKILVEGTDTELDFQTTSIITNLKSLALKSDTYSTSILPASSGQSEDLTFYLPPTDGTNGQVLSTDGAGVLSWVDQTSGGGGGGAANSTSATWSSADGATKTVNHGFGTRNVLVQVLDNDNDYQTIDVCVTRPNDNDILLESSSAPDGSWTVLLLEIS